MFLKVAEDGELEEDAQDKFYDKTTESRLVSVFVNLIQGLDLCVTACFYILHYVLL